MSESPIDEKPAGAPSGGGGIYIVGIVILAGLGAGLFFWKRSNTPAAPVTQQSAAVSAKPKEPEAPQLAYAPPPPPAEEEVVDAGSDAGPVAAKGTAAPAGTGGALGPCGCQVKGDGTPALQSALTGRAQSAKGCYNRALRNGEVSGSMTVSVQIGPSGAVCGASISNDSVHSGEISQCVLSRFRGQSFPPPSGGCLTANIPISFTIKQ